MLFKNNFLTSLKNKIFAKRSYKKSSYFNRVAKYTLNPALWERLLLAVEAFISELYFIFFILIYIFLKYVVVYSYFAVYAWFLIYSIFSIIGLVALYLMFKAFRNSWFLRFSRRALRNYVIHCVRRNNKWWK